MLYKNVHVIKFIICFFSVCFGDHLLDTTYVYAGVNDAGSSSPPSSIYFGSGFTDSSVCEDACRRHPQCHFFTLIPSDRAAWSGMCYGGNSIIASTNTDVGFISGTRVACN